VRRRIGLGTTLLLLGAGLLVLSVTGAYELWEGQHQTVAIIALAQVPIWGIAAWLVTARTSRVIAHPSRALVSILIIGFVMRLIVVVAPPASEDVYRYVWDGRVQAAGINPYRYLPVDPALQTLRDEKIYPMIHRANYAPTIYPPMAQIVYLVATRISETVTFMKFVAVAFEGLAVWAILQLLQSRGLASSRVLLYLWHPLPLWSFAGDGHIDAAAIAFLLLAFVAADRRSPVLAGVALAAGALVKYFPIVAGPALYKRWDWRLPTAFLATAAILYLPYLGVGSKVFGFLGGYVTEEGFSDGSGIFLWQLIGAAAPLHDHALAIYLPAAALIMAATALILMLRSPTERGDLAAAMWLGVTFLVLVSPHYPWYFAWLIPFVCFYPVIGVGYLTCAVLYLNLADWPPNVRVGLGIYGVTFVLLAGQFLVRHLSRKEAPRGSAIAA
jgi:alpha-1,6-mannosyltransferase